MSIQWFPGHMAKAKRLLLENIKLVDVVIELRDARIPLASANPLLDEIIGQKPRIIVLAKTDLADKLLTRQWIDYMEQVEQVTVVGLNLKQTNLATRALLPHIQALSEPLVPKSKKGNFPLRPARTMVVGIPNVGKSSLINSLSGKARAKTGALPGVTRTKQWIKLASRVELLDTPGILWPRLDDTRVARLLAVTGAVGQGGFDEYELTAWFLQFLARNFHAALGRYQIEDYTLSGEQLLEQVGRARGCLVASGKVDLLRAAAIVLADFRTGKMGPITLERPPSHDQQGDQDA
ncbi:MAG: ribosome biogenesis GTPase YlqF [Firmicutes bacterium]|nr:ribosome biogenesis GTPase YlqF [Bacillota bacterium]